jgi:hypothetical protein
LGLSLSVGSSLDVPLDLDLDLGSSFVEDNLVVVMEVEVDEMGCLPAFICAIQYHKKKEEGQTVSTFYYAG